MRKMRGPETDFFLSIFRIFPQKWFKDQSNTQRRLLQGRMCVVFTDLLAMKLDNNLGYVHIALYLFLSVLISIHFTCSHCSGYI